MSNEHIQSLLADLGKEIGLDGLTLDENNYCCLIVDTLSVNIESDGEELFIYANVGRLPDDPRERAELQADLLDANYFWNETGGGLLAASKSEGFVLYLVRERISTLEISSLQNMLENFINIAATWMQRIGSGSPSPDEAKGPDTPLNPGMRV